MRLLQLLVLGILLLPLTACHTILYSRVDNPYSYLAEGELWKVKEQKPAKAERATLNLTGHTAAPVAKPKAQPKEGSLTKLGQIGKGWIKGGYSTVSGTVTKLTGDKFWQ